uniref:G-protein coupled receptors family 1 profile domain-containing protein n=1 Tax=Panagrellus redivivus TaxID=6233 RepID=A0A7E4VFV6_PANRE
MASTSAEAIRELAAKESPGALDEFFSESTFVYAGELDGLTRTVCFVCALFMTFILLVFIASVIWFIFQVLKLVKTDVHLSQASTSLLISSAVQATLFVVFLFMPITCMLISWAYCLDNTANIINALVLIMSIHGTLDMLTTLYFVVPYRNYIVSLFSRKQTHMVSINISVRF